MNNKEEKTSDEINQEFLKGLDVMTPEQGEKLRKAFWNFVTKRDRLHTIQRDKFIKAIGRKNDD